MRAPRPHPPAAPALARTVHRSARLGKVGVATLLAAWTLAVACGEDGDHTDVCVGPGCVNFQGIAGKNSLTANGLLDAGFDASSPVGGAGGASGTGGAGGAAGEDGGSEPPPEPCEIAFESPLSADAGAITLGETDDVDGTACGVSFSARVTLLSNAASVNLFVNDNPLGEQLVSEGAVSFDAELGNRGATANTLRAEATMTDGRGCSAELGSSVLVDCPGPSCSIDAPQPNRDGFLNQSDDADDQTSGLQTDVSVITEPEHAEQTVLLEIDDDPEAVPPATVVVNGEQGVATFPGVSLEEGTRQVRAECRDEFGILTRSPLIEWKVDLSACSLEIDSVAGGEDPITPESDLDENPANGLDVLVRGSVEGENCESLQIGECGEDPTEIRLSGLVGDDGAFIVPIKIPAQTASIELCAHVTDAAGNASAPEERRDVSVRTTSPSVAITSPTGGARFNSNGNSGATQDLNTGSESTCEVAVSVDCSDVGVAVQLLADDVLIDSAPCVEQSGLEPFAGRATFASASLPSKDDGSATTLTARQSLSGVDPGVSDGVQVQADCNAPSCTIESPASRLLNATLDDSSDAGFQVDFVVATDADAAGRDVRLTLDGDTGGSLVLPAAAGGAGALATFDNITLSEASHDVQAFCSDAAGNVQSTPSATWTVDLSPCATTLVIASGHNPIVPSDDLDGATPDLQVSVTGQTAGTSCTSVRVGLCSSMSGDFTDLDSNGSFALTTSVPSSGITGLELCAEVQDDAGNVTSQSTAVNVRVEAPIVSFNAPLPGAAFNVDNGGCATTVVVNCTEEGTPVELSVDAVAQSPQDCIGGQASFPLTLTSKNDGSTTELTATQTAQGVPSAPASITVQADCEAPVVNITSPVCGSNLALTGDDVAPGTTGLQVDVSVANGGVPDVTLTVTTSSSTDIESSGDTTTTEFTAVDLGGAGSVTLAACAIDAQGNQGCSASCALTIEAEPAIAITSPRPPATFTVEDDCDTVADNLQIPVQGTSSATDGSDVELSIGTGSPLIVPLTGGVFSACVPAPDGVNQTLTATVTDSLTELAASATVLVSINTSPPDAIAAPTFTITDRRQGNLTLNWSSVLDASNDPLVAYRLRCSRTDITTEQIWDTATAFPVTVTPAAVEGTAQSQPITGFRTGSQRFCMVRGQDAFGQLSPLTGTGPTTALVSNPFLTLEYSAVMATSVTGTRVSIAALGDINGDGQQDFAYGSQSNGVQIFFGGPDLDPGVDVTIAPPPVQTPFNHEFGGNVSGLGDINGDGRPDFAVTARALDQPGVVNGGAVYVFFGRDSGTGWPATVNVAASPGCGADLCLHGSETSALLGSSVTATDFDGDGQADLVVGANNRIGSDNTTRVGRVYVILGGSQLDGLADPALQLPGATLSGFTIAPPTLNTRSFGINVAAVGRLGNDVPAELVISATGRNNQPSDVFNGEAFFVSGRAHTTGAGTLASIVAPTAFAVGTPAGFGNPMRALGDINGDQLGDVWVSTNFDLNGVSPVYLGRGTGYSGVSLFGFTNDGLDNDWGTYVATGFHTELGRLGDLDGNGFDDVLVGAVFNQNTNAPGATDLFYSDATTQSRLRSTADMHLNSSGNGQMTPSFVGDVTGDGFRDIVILDSGPSLTTHRLTLLY